MRPEAAAALEDRPAGAQHTEIRPGEAKTGPKTFMLRPEESKTCLCRPMNANVSQKKQMWARGVSVSTLAPLMSAGT
jgi:hypothetical protein